MLGPTTLIWRACTILLWDTALENHLHLTGEQPRAAGRKQGVMVRQQLGPGALTQLAMRPAPPGQALQDWNSHKGLLRDVTVVKTSGNFTGRV